MRTRTFLFTLLIAAGLVLSACGPVSPAASHSLTVTGNGTVPLSPDIAYINIGVHTENQDLPTAVNDNNAQTRGLIDALKNAGVATEDIQTSNFNVYTNNQGYDKVTGQPLPGKVYVVDNTVFVTARDLGKLGSLLTIGVNSGANYMNGITFDVADKSKALAEARQKALADANSLAMELAKNAGVKLGGIENINYTTNPPIPLYGMGGGGAASNVVTNVPIQPGKIQVSVTVDVSYELK